MWKLSVHGVIEPSFAPFGSARLCQVVWFGENVDIAGGEGCWSLEGSQSWFRGRNGHVLGDQSVWRFF